MSYLHCVYCRTHDWNAEALLCPLDGSFSGEASYCFRACFSRYQSEACLDEQSKLAPFPLICFVVALWIASTLSEFEWLEERLGVTGHLQMSARGVRSVLLSHGAAQSDSDGFAYDMN